MKAAFALLIAAGCAESHALGPEAPCEEAGYAIASRAEECSGDAEYAAGLQAQFAEAYTCVEPQLPDPLQERDLFECALVLRNIACELANEYGDDLNAWLQSSPVCAAITVPVGGAG